MVETEIKYAKDGRMLARIMTDVLSIICGFPGHYVSTADFDAALEILRALIRKERADAWREGAEAECGVIAEWLRKVKTSQLPATIDTLIAVVEHRGHRALPLPGGEHE